MNKATRKAVIAGNWKMNKTPAEATALINDIKATIADKKTDGCDIIVGVPFVDLAAAVEAVKDSALDLEKEDLNRCGVLVSSGIGGIGTIQQECEKGLEKFLKML